MVANQIRYAEKFVGSAGTTIFPLPGYEYEPAQGFRKADSEMFGTDYAWDGWGFAPAAKETGVESVRFLMVGSTPGLLSEALDDMLAVLINSGKGQLYSVDSFGERRWCWARLDSRPGYSSTVEMWGYTAVTLRFRRYSDWFSESANVLAVSILSSPSTTALTNNGNAPSYSYSLVIAPLVAAGYNNPKITNLTNGMSIQVARVSTTTNHRVKIDGRTGEVLFSNNAGSTWSGDWANAILPAGQVDLFRFEPGVNSIRLENTGSPNFSFTAEVVGQWH